MIKRQENKRVQNTLEKSQNYSRYPLTFDDNYIIMANMTNNNNTIATKDNNTMRTIKRDGQVWRVFIECLPSGGVHSNKAMIDNVFTKEVRLVEAFPKSEK